MLEVADLHSYYGDSHVLQGVSLAVAEREVVCLMGRNGVGKTTTLKSIIGLVQPRQGRVVFRGGGVAGLPPFRIARLGIAYVPEDRRIFPDLSADDNLELARRASGGRAGVWTREKVLQLLPVLERVIGRPGRFLSGGEQKMLAIGRALVANPYLLLMDEPSEGLSPIVIQQLVEVIRTIRGEGLTVLLADQNLEFCRQVADRAYILEHGAVRHEGPLAEISRNEEIVRRYLAV